MSSLLGSGSQVSPVFTQKSHAAHLHERISTRRYKRRAARACRRKQLNHDHAWARFGLFSDLLAVWAVLLDEVGVAPGRARRRAARDGTRLLRHVDAVCRVPSVRTWSDEHQQCDDHATRDEGPWHGVASGSHRETVTDSHWKRPGVHAAQQPICEPESGQRVPADQAGSVRFLNACS